ncbi:hypothetical protein Hypma_001328 [Hypsizygus marmoreus]|uniref:Uncharacterized protein n=1 Tax=Hypsizygus marmoreus TaxID=39966 RepID=A0A369KBK1_HYPMA|nr:hypothetical protein Hypma_001328 [Hypsizygus marmoreus]
MLRWDIGNCRDERSRSVAVLLLCALEPSINKESDVFQAASLPLHICIRQSSSSTPSTDRSGSFFDDAHFNPMAFVPVTETTGREQPYCDSQSSTLQGQPGYVKYCNAESEDAIRILALRPNLKRQPRHRRPQVTACCTPIPVFSA